MAHAKSIQVKETAAELKRFQKGQPLIIIKRINMLLAIKNNKVGNLSKKQLATLTGVDPNSVQKWRTIYLNQGIKGLLYHGRVGFKPSVISPEEHKKIEKKLSQPKHALKGYTELMRWIKDELGKEIKYTTIVEYSKRHFGSKIKVARKSHIKKDEEAVETFKKTSVKLSRKQPSK